jgi:hypothetical protein
VGRGRGASGTPGWRGWPPATGLRRAVVTVPHSADARRRRRRTHAGATPPPYRCPNSTFPAGLDVTRTVESRCGAVISASPGVDPLL